MPVMAYSMAASANFSWPPKSRTAFQSAWSCLSSGNISACRSNSQRNRWPISWIVVVASERGVRVIMTPWGFVRSMAPRDCAPVNVSLRFW
ncbi:MAG: hypothetical protein LBR71_04110 [Synergistaceae bacterium]|nr:hypothetical protein [Synergistaceae bacterium]